MTALRDQRLLPTPFEVLLLFGVSYFFWFFANGLSGVIFGVAAVSAGIVLTRVLMVRPIGGLPSQAAWIAVGITVVLAAPFIASGDFRVTQLAIAGYTAIIVIGLNLLSGNLGQISFGHAAFVGIGAYTVAISVNEWGMNIMLAVILAILMSALAGVMLGVPAVRLSGLYLAIATAGLGIIFPQILTLEEISKYTGGFQGISLFSEKYSAPISTSWLTDQRWHYFLTMSALFVAVVLAYNMVNSAAGRALKAVHESELAATAMGINVPYTKVSMFAISAAYAGFGGALLFLLGNRFVSPESFGVLIAVNFLVAMVLGGIASIPGSVLGGFIFVYFYREGLETITSQTEKGNDAWLIAVGILLAAFALFAHKSVRLYAEKLAGRINHSYGNLATILLRVIIAIAAGLLIAYIFRQGAEHLFNLENLRNGITGASLIMIILFMPNGMIGLINDIRTLTWDEIGRRLQALLPSKEETVHPPVAMGGASDTAD